jgi:hypothetical protein
MWLLAGLMSNVAIAWIEWYNRTSAASSFTAQLPITFVPILIAQLGLWYSWKHAPSMMIAWFAFSLGNNALRLLSVKFVLRESLTMYHIAGAICIVLGGWLIANGSRFNG